MGLLNALVDAVKGAAEAISSAFSGGSSDSSSSSSSSGSSGLGSSGLGSSGGTKTISGAYSSGSGNGNISRSNGTVSIGKSYGGGTVSTSGGSSSGSYGSGTSNPFFSGGGIHSEVADQNYQDALSARDNYISQNSGYAVDDASRYNYEQGLAQYDQRVADAERARNMFTQSYNPNYKSSAELNGTSAEDARAAAQRAADTANERGQSRTNYLKTYMTEDSNWTNSKYLQPETPKKTNYLSDDVYQSLGIDPETGKGQMDDRDAWSPNWTDDKRLKETNGFQSVNDIIDWGKNIGKAVGTSVGGSAVSNMGVAYEAGNEGRMDRAVEEMQQPWENLLTAARNQILSDNPDEWNDQVKQALNAFLGYADAIGPGMKEQVYSNYEKAIEAIKADPENAELFMHLRTSGNSGILPDTTTFEGASTATRDLAQDIFGQSQGYTEAAKAAAGNTTIGNIVTDVAQNVLEQGVDAAVAWFASMGAVPEIAKKVYQAVSLGSMGLRVFGQTTNEVRAEGGNFGQQTFEAGLAAGIEILTEKMSGGIAKFYGKGDTDEIVEEIARRITKSDFGRTVIRAIGGMVGEAAEEVVSGVAEPAVKAVHSAESALKYRSFAGWKEIASDAGYSALIASLAALVGGSSSYINGSNAAANETLKQTDAIQAELEQNGMSKGDAKKAAPNVQKYQEEGIDGLSKKDQKTLNNALIKSLYGIDVELDSAMSTKGKQATGDKVSKKDASAAEKTLRDRLGDSLYEEYEKYNGKDTKAEDVEAAAKAFENNAAYLVGSEVGDVLLDANNNEVGKVTEVNDYGMTVEFKDGHTESVVFAGNNGLLDPNSDLAKTLGEDGEGAIVNAEEAKIFAQEAAAKRKAQEEAKAAAANAPKATTDSGTGTVAKPQQPQKPTKKAPTPGKPASMESTDSGTGTAKAAQPKTVYTSEDGKYSIVNNGNGYSVLDSDGNTVGTAKAYSDAVEIIRKGNASGSQSTSQKSPTPGKPASNESTDSGTGTATKANAEQPTSESKDAKNGSPLTGFLTNEQEKNATFEGKYYDTDYRLRFIGEETDGDSSTRQYTISVKGKDGKYRPISEGNQPTLFYGDEIGQALAKAHADSLEKQNAEYAASHPERTDIGTAKDNYKDYQSTINIAEDELKGDKVYGFAPKQGTDVTYHGFQIHVSYSAAGGFSADIFGGKGFHGATVEEALGQAIEYLYTHETDEEWNKYEDQKRGETAQPENNSSSTPNALADAAQGKKPATSEAAPESSTIASDETGNSVPTQAQEGTQAPNEMLNNASESEVEEYSEEEMSDEDEWDDEEEYNYRGDVSEEEANYFRSRATDSFSDKLSEAFNDKGYVTINDVADAVIAANSNFDTHTKQVSNFNTTNDVLNALQDAISKTDNSTLASYLKDVYQTVSAGKSIYDGIYSGSVDLASISNQDISKAFQYIDAAAEQIANENQDKPAFVNAKAHDSDPAGWYKEGKYLPSVIKADLLRQVNLAQQEKSSAKTDNKLDGTKPVAEDDHGNKLGKNVANFFRNSKLRDALGRLRTFFHGTGNLEHKNYDFKHADDGLTMWLASEVNTTASYVGTLREASYFDQENGPTRYVQSSSVKENAPEIIKEIISDLESAKEIGSKQANKEIDDAIKHLNGLVDDINNGENIDPNRIWAISSGLNHTIDAIYYNDNIDHTDEDLKAVKRLIEISDKISDLNEEVEIPGGYGKQANVPVYVNMENPLVVDGQGANWNEIPVDADPEIIQVCGYIGRTVDKDYYGNHTLRTRDIALAAYALGYDGVLIQNITDYGGSQDLIDEGLIDDERVADILAVFNSNQVKDVKNENPTKSDDFRFKLDLEAMGFTQEEQEKIARNHALDDEAAAKAKAEALPKLQEYAKKAGISSNPYGLVERMLDVLFGNADTYGTDASVETNMTSVAEMSAAARRNQDNGNADNKAYQFTQSDEYQRNVREGDLYRLLQDYEEEYGSAFTLAEVDAYERDQRGGKGNPLYRYQDILNELKTFGITQESEIYDVMAALEYYGEADFSNETPEGKRGGKKGFEGFSENEIEDIVKLLGNFSYSDKKTDRNNPDYDPDVKQGRVTSPQSAYDANEGDYGIFTIDQNKAYAGNVTNSDSPGFAYDTILLSKYMNDDTNAYGTPAERIEYLQKYFPDAEFRVSDDGLRVEEVVTHKTKNPLISHRTRTGETIFESVSQEEQDWWNDKGWKAVTNLFAEKGQDNKTIYSEASLLPARQKAVSTDEGYTKNRGEQFNPNITDTTLSGSRGNRGSVRTLKHHGMVYYLKVGEGMYKHFIDSHLYEAVNEVIANHEQKVKDLRERIANGYNYLSSQGILSTKDGENYTVNQAAVKASNDAEQRIAKLQKQLEAEQKWLDGLAYKKENNYTLSKFFSDNSGVISQAEKDLVKSKIDGTEDYSGYGFGALQNTMNDDLARDLINSIYEEANDGINSRTSDGSFKPISGSSGERYEVGNGILGTGEGTLESGEPVARGASSVTGLSAYDTANQKTSGTEADKSRSAGTGRVMDDSGAVRQVYGTFGPEEQGRRPVSAADIAYQAESAHEEFNNAPVESLVIKPRNSTEAGATVQAKKIDDRIYLDGESLGEINPESYRDPNNKDSERLVRIAQTIKDAAAEAGVAVIQLKGQLYSTNTDENGQYYTNTTSALTDLANGYIAISELTADNAGKVMLDVLHEVTHENTFAKFGSNSRALMSFIDRLSKESGVDIKAKATKVIKEYSADGETFDADCADEIISRIAEGHDCNGNFTQAEVEALQDALFNSDEFIDMIRKAPSTKALVAYSRMSLRNKPSAPDVGKNRVATSVGYTPSTAPVQNQSSTTYYPSGERETPETARQRTARLVGEAIQANMLGDFDRAQELLRMAGTNPQTEADNGMYSQEMQDMYLGKQRKDSDVRYKKDLGSDDISPMDDESFDALIAEENAREAAALEGVGTPIDQQDIDNLVNEASADEIDLLNSRGGNVSAEDAGRFSNLVDQASASEEETLNSFREESDNDIDIDSEGRLDALVDEENRSVENIMNDFAESSANQYPERRFSNAKDYYGKAYDDVVSKVATKHARVSSRSSFTHADIYKKLYGNTPDAEYNFGRLQKLNQNIDSLLKGKMSVYAFNAFAKNMASEQGIAQILNDDIQKEFADLAKLEEKATGKDRNESDVINFQYAAADAVAHLCARMDMVEKTERARVRLDTLAKDHGKTNKNAIGNALDWYNRMQISGDNFWRMAGNWDAASRNQGYALAQEHNKCIATRISEEAKLKDYFSGIDKNSKQFRDFANGTTMSNVDFEGHKISLMEAVKFIKICDTMRAFANENRRPDWQRVAALGGFAFEGKDGKPVFVDIQGSKKNGGAERVQWVQDHYDAAMAEIQANKAASEYMKACEEMYWDASQTAEKVHSKVNGYERYMYGKGKYTDIHYASKDGTVDFSYKDRDAIDVHDTGIMQKRTRVNGGYVICNPMSRSIDAYISQISNYIAFEEFGQKLGVLNDSKSINGNYANTVGDAYGSQYSKWFDNYVKSMTLYRETDPKKLTDKALQKARQAMMTGALSLSVSVPIKQVSSFFDTMGMLDPRAVGKVFATNPFGVKQKGIKNYLFKSRGQSISDPDIAELFGDKGLLGRFKNTGVGRTIMKATNIMDETAVSNVYMACVYDTEFNTLPADKLYKNGKNFKDGLTTEGQFYVDSKFEQVLLGTQPIFTPQARNELARTDNQLLRMFQTFRTQQTQNYNRALQSLSEWKAASKNGGDTGAAFKKVRQTVQGQLAASVSLAALNAIATTLLHKHHKYKDDDDEFDKDKFLKRFGLDALESFMGNALWIGDLTKWAIDRADISDSREFYGVASGALGTAWTIGTSAVDLYRNIQEDGWTQSNKVSARYLAGNVATAFGKPLNNAYAMINAGWQWYADLAGIERKYDDIFLQWAYVTDTPQNRLANAILKDDKDAIADLIDEIGEDKLSNTVSYGALDKYKQGKIDEAEYVEILMNFANMSYKDASKEVQKKKTLIDSGISQYNGIDGRDGRAKFYDTYSDRFQSRSAYKDFFADVKAGKADGKHNTYYTTYNGKQSEVSANQSSIIDRLNENIRAGNITYDTAKLIWENYYGYSTYKSGAWQYVGK